MHAMLLKRFIICMIDCACICVTMLHRLTVEANHNIVYIFNLIPGSVVFMWLVGPSWNEGTNTVYTGIVCYL